MALVKNRVYREPPVIGMAPCGYAGGNWDALGFFGLTRGAAASGYRAAPLRQVGHDAGGNLQMVRDETGGERRFLPPESKLAVPVKVVAYKKPRVTEHTRKNGRVAIVPVCSYVRGRARGAIRTGVIFSDDPVYNKWLDGSLCQQGPDSSDPDCTLVGNGDGRSRRACSGYTVRGGKLIRKYAR